MSFENSGGKVAEEMTELEVPYQRNSGGLYKIELRLSKQGEKSSLIRGSLQFWLSGSALNGNGDELVFRCPKCSAFIPQESLGHAVIPCTVCNTSSPQEHLKEMILFNSSPETISHLVDDAFNQCKRDADIYIKWIKNIGGKTLAQATQDFKTGLSPQVHEATALFTSLRSGENKEWVIYPLERIVADLSNGASARAKFLSLLKA